VREIDSEAFISVAVDSSGDVFIGGETHLSRLGIAPRKQAKRRETVSRQQSDSSDAFVQALTFVRDGQTDAPRGR
jgi:hypothetical protein